MTMLPRICQHCGVTFLRPRAEVARGQGKFCSPICHYESRKRKNLSDEFFWSNVLCMLATGCWLWQGDCGKRGYGNFSRDGRHVTTHRLSWEMHFGPPPAGEWVLHRCAGKYPQGDFTGRACVNPQHLYLGGPKENAADREADHRRPASGWAVR